MESGRSPLPETLVLGDSILTSSPEEQG
eukprot:Gb_38268 [translate_table: standard]